MDNEFEDTSGAELASEGESAGTATAATVSGGGVALDDPSGVAMTKSEGAAGAADCGEVTEVVGAALAMGEEA